VKKFVRACNEISNRHSLPTVELTDAELETIYGGDSLLSGLLGGSTPSGSAPSGNTTSGDPQGDVSVAGLNPKNLLGGLTGGSSPLGLGSLLKTL